VLLPFWNEHKPNQPQNQRRPGSPHSKQKTPPPPKHQANSFPHLPRKYCAPSILEPTHPPTNPKTREAQVHPTASRRLPRRPNIKRIHSEFTPKVLCSFHFGTNTNPTNPKTREGQVHPTASRRLPRHPNIKRIHSTFTPQVLCSFHFGTNTNPTPKPEKARFTPQQAEDASAAQTSSESIPSSPESTLLVPFWNEQHINSPLALFPQPVQPRPGDRGGSASAAKERYSPPLKFESSFSSAVPLCTAVPDPGKIKRARAQPHRNHCGSVSGGICD
jgi:hypothetical protein